MMQQLAMPWKMLATLGSLPDSACERCERAARHVQKISRSVTNYFILRYLPSLTLCYEQNQ